MPYSQQVLDHYRDPRNVGSLPKDSPEVGTALIGSPACGDVLKLQIRVDGSGRIIEARFKSFGCGSAIAAASLATEWLRGRTLDEAAEITNVALAQELDLPAIKVHCSVLAEDAIRQALANYQAKRSARNGF